MTGGCPGVSTFDSRMTCKAIPPFHKVKTSMHRASRTAGEWLGQIVHRHWEEASKSIALTLRCTLQGLTIRRVISSLKDKRSSVVAPLCRSSEVLGNLWEPGLQGILFEREIDTTLCRHAELKPGRSGAQTFLRSQEGRNRAPDTGAVRPPS